MTRWKALLQNCFQVQLRCFIPRCANFFLFFFSSPFRSHYRRILRLFVSNSIVLVSSRVTWTTDSFLRDFNCSRTVSPDASHFPGAKRNKHRRITPRPCSSLICLSVPPLSRPCFQVIRPFFLLQASRFPLTYTPLRVMESLKRMRGAFEFVALDFWTFLAVF